jgi:hypothetical protein
MDDAERDEYEKQIKQLNEQLDDAMEQLGSAIELLNEIRRMTKNV